MYVRMTFFKVKLGKMDELRNIYVNHVIPAHKEHKGIRFVHLFEGTDAADEGISLTAWDTRGIWRHTRRAGITRRFWRCLPRCSQVHRH